nr:hypothetical protein CFP56_20828 [Quercus suber]
MFLFLVIAVSSALLAKFYSQGDHNIYKKSNLDSRALRTRKQDYLVGGKIGSSVFYCTGKKYDVADLLKCARPFTIKVAVGRDVKRKLLVYPVYMESRLSTIGVDNPANGGLGDFLTDGVSKDTSGDGGLGDSPADSVLEDFPAKGGLGDTRHFTGSSWFTPAIAHSRLKTLFHLL